MEISIFCMKKVVLHVLPHVPCPLHVCACVACVCVCVGVCVCVCVGPAHCRHRDEGDITSCDDEIVLRCGATRR